MDLVIGLDIAKGEIKLQFQVALDQVLPEHHSVFSAPYGKLSLTLLSYPTALDVHRVSDEILAEEMGQFGSLAFS